MKGSLDTFEWLLGEKTRDERDGPVFFGMQISTGPLIKVRRLAFPREAKLPQSLSSRLHHKQNIPTGSHIVSYLGFEEIDGHYYSPRELVLGGSLKEYIQRYGAIPLPLVRSLGRQIVLCLRQLQDQGLVTTFLDLECSLVGNKGDVNIDAPVVDVTTTGHKLPRASSHVHSSHSPGSQWARGRTCRSLMCGCLEL